MWRNGGYYNLIGLFLGVCLYLFDFFLISQKAKFATIPGITIKNDTIMIWIWIYDVISGFPFSALTGKLLLACEFFRLSPSCPYISQLLTLDYNNVLYSKDLNSKNYSIKIWSWIYDIISCFPFSIRKPIIGV